MISLSVIKTEVPILDMFVGIFLASLVIQQITET